MRSRKATLKSENLGAVKSENLGAAKSENLEKWKKVYEDEIAELKESAEKHTEEMVKANNKIAEFNRRDQVWQYGLSSFQGRGTKL